LAVLTLALIFTTSAFAQDYLINQQLNGNNPPGSNFNSTTASGGQIYRGEGAGYSSYFIAPSTTLTPAQQCAAALTAASGVSVAATSITSATYTGGYLICATAASTIPGVTATAADWVFAGDWSNFTAFINAKRTLGAAQSETNAVPSGAPSTSYVEAEQCLDCHHYSATAGATYLLTGHKNGFRKIVNGQPLHSSDGSTYTGITWSPTGGGQPTSSTGVPVYYTIAGWMTPGAAPDNETTSYTCAYCHVGGYNPTTATTASAYLTSEDGTFNWAGSGTAQTTYPGPEPTQAVPLSATITGVSVTTAGTSVTFTTSAATNLSQNALVLVNGLTTATGTVMNGTVFELSASATGNTFTATAQLPGAYFKSGTVANETGTMTQLVPIPVSAMSRKGENGSTDSSWYLTGVTCERCHIAAVGTSTANSKSTIEFNAGHEIGAVTGSVSTPVIPMGNQATELCMECHRLQVVSSGVQAITPYYPPLAKASTAGVYSDGDYQGSEFLNSPHAQFVGNLYQNQQGTADLSVDFNGTYYSSAFNGFGNTVSATSGSGLNAGCTGCHDPHQTMVGTEFTGLSAAAQASSTVPSIVAINKAAAMQPSGTHFGALATSGTVAAKNCNNCHGGTGPATTVTAVSHPTGVGTPLPNGGTAADTPGSCMVCHMQGATGQPKSHLFRINPLVSYYTYNTGANYNATSAVSGYSIGGNFVTFTTATNLATTVGEEITISGSTVAALNGSYIVTSVGTGSFTASLLPLGAGMNGSIPAALTSLSGGSITATATVSAVPFNYYTPPTADGYSILGATTTNTASLYAAVITTNTVALSTTSTTITVASNAGINVGQTVSGTGIKSGTTVASVSGTNTVVLSQDPTAASPANTTLTFAASTSIAVSSNKGLAVDQTVTGPGIAANTVVTAISGNTVTISSAMTSFEPAGTSFSFASPSDSPFTNAIGLDVDIACGQCHGGGAKGTNPYGITPAVQGAPVITRGELAKYAANMHPSLKVATPNAPAAPEFNTGTGQAGGTFAASQAPLTVTLTDADSAATIYYCLGASCNPATGTAYTTGIPIALGAAQTINAVALVTTGGVQYSSPVVQESYSFTAGTATISPAGGTYPAAQTVTLGNGPGFYCTEVSQGGSAPCTPTTAFTSGQQITVSVNSTVRAVAGGGTTGLAQGTIVDAAYVIQSAPPVGVPTISPAGGTYNAQQTVTLTGAKYYCIEASQSAPCTPTTAYTTPLTVSVNSTVRAIANGSTTIVDAAYVIQPASPTITPSVTVGAFTGTLTTGSAVITNPSATLAAANVGMIVKGTGIPVGTTITALSPLTMSANATASATGTLTLSGMYGASFTVTLTDATATGAAIYYTTDGSDPRTSSTKSTYSSAVTIPANATTTFNAAAVYSQTIGGTPYTAVSSVTGAFFVVN
jgi:hypothetical protein